ncbi:MAG: His/Gly/Thr/Pro-type tRNA ligase C-terminal domain-containing protein, partial [Saprospiraceae bacterium]|nr:His/Gly/Thr/Pro-type tRNA ligase C-terminal domain-containing protein [Saprospiraceae bacterium]
AKAFDVKYLTEANKEDFVWATSWGVSTRLVGGMIMTHSDDEGLVLPPRLAPIQVVIVPIPKPNGELLEVADKIVAELQSHGIRVKVDKDKKKRPGFKFAEYEMRGVPVRLGLGKRDLENNTIEVARRDTKTKEQLPLENLGAQIEKLLEDIQNNLLQRAKDFRSERTTVVDDLDTFKEVLENKGGFISAHWDGTTESELKMKELTTATIRCIPNDQEAESGKDLVTGKESKGRVLFAKAY